MYMSKPNDRVLTLNQLLDCEKDALGKLILDHEKYTSEENELVQYTIESFTTKLMKQMCTHWLDDDNE